MKRTKITPENFDLEYVDPIEQQQIDKFVCDEMERHIHRYIKAMNGSRHQLDTFVARMRQLKLHDRERAIRRYIDFHRKALEGLEFKMVLLRAIANYCDTFQYFLQLVNDKRRMIYYYVRLKDRYIRFHTVFEEDGRFGIKDHEGNIIVPAEYEFLRTPYVFVDDLLTIPIIAARDGKMGLILPDGHGTQLTPFNYDNISVREEYPYFEATIGDRTVYLDNSGKEVEG